MMNSQYYNAQANSQGFQQSTLHDSRYGELAGDTRKHYEGVPATFKVAELQARQRVEAQAALARKDSAGPHLDAAQQKTLRPATVSIYQLPQNPKPEPARPPRAEYYR
jgi:hypothetical protein